MKKYVKPCMYAEEFVSNDYVSACYVMNCNISGWFHDDDYDGNYKREEAYQNGADGEVQFKANSKPGLTKDHIYKGVSQPNNIWGWLIWLGTLAFKGTKYSNEKLFEPINPGLYIMNNGSKVYASTQSPYLAPGHPNRS